jgi:DNA-binding MarR family transcriptional regulator
MHLDPRLQPVQVMAALKELGSATRAELRAYTGLSRATLGTLVGRLISEGTVTEASDEETGRRNAT